MYCTRTNCAFTHTTLPRFPVPFYGNTSFPVRPKKNNTSNETHSTVVTNTNVEKNVNPNENNISNNNVDIQN